MTDSTQPPEDNAGFGGQGGQPTGPQGGQPASGGYQPPTYEQPQYGQQPYGQQPGYGSSPTNGLAIAALVVGILALLSFFTILGGIVLGIAAVILGALGLSKANQLNGTGKGLAIGGIVTGLLGGLLSLLIVVGLFAVFDNVDLNEGGVIIDGTEFEFPS